MGDKDYEEMMKGLKHIDDTLNELRKIASDDFLIGRLQVMKRTDEFVDKKVKSTEKRQLNHKFVMGTE